MSLSLKYNGLSKLSIRTVIDTLSNISKIKISSPLSFREYVFFGGTESSTTGTLSDLSSFTTIKVAGVGAGGNGSPNHPGSCCPGRGAGGGAAANLIGNSFPISDNGITSIYYEVGGSDGQDTFIQINGPGGTDLIRFHGGSPNPNQTGGAGGPASGGGPNCVAGGAGAPGAGRYGSGPPASPVTNAAAGGGGAGGAVNDGQPGTVGGTGGSSDFTPIASQIITTIFSSRTWSIGPAGPHAGGGGGYGSTANTTNGIDAGDVSWAEGGGGGGVFAPGGSGNPGAGGAGAGIRWTDPSDPTNNGKFFGGGGGAKGNFNNPEDGRGGKGFLIIQLTSNN